MTPPNGFEQQARIIIRYPFDIGFQPTATAPVSFQADGQTQPPGGPDFTAEGTLFGELGVMSANPLSRAVIVAVGNGIGSSMGPFRQTIPGNPPMMPGRYLLRVRFLAPGGNEQSTYSILIQLVL